MSFRVICIEPTRAGNACQVRRGYARVYSTNNGLSAPHVTQEPDYQAALAVI